MLSLKDYIILTLLVAQLSLFASLPVIMILLVPAGKMAKRYYSVHFLLSSYWRNVFIEMSISIEYV